MNKILYIFAFTASMFASCQQLDFNEEFKTSSKNEPVISKFNVSLSDVNTLVSILDKNSSKKQLDYIEPIAYNGDTILYIVNYKENKGWKIISGDRRTESILASAEDGVFKLKEINPGVGNWLVELADNILALKQVGKQDTTLGDFTLWSNIDKLQATQTTANGNGGIKKILNPEDGSGYWELYDVTSEMLPTITVGPLLNTKWAQNDPWNTCVPLIKNSTVRCKVGCVAVAGAQMLYFLHYAKGIPYKTYQSGTCTGYSNTFLDKNYSFNFSNLTSTVWDDMSQSISDTRDRTKSAILMGYVGMNVDMDYSGDNSSSDDSRLTNFFHSIGINCSNIDYNSTQLKNSLANSTPVVLSARRRENTINILGIQFYQYFGHAWIADGYENFRTKYTYHYRWVDSDVAMYSKPQKAKVNNETYTEEYVSSYNLLIMNWGYDGTYDTGRYNYDGAWTTSIGRDYAFDREMIIGF